MDISITNIYFQDHIFCRNKLIIHLKAILSIDIIKNILLELIVGYKYELAILIANFTSFIIQE